MQSNYEYERQGAALVRLAFEPLTGKRLIQISKQRTKADHCRFQQCVVASWPEADKIVRVQDNLNTHNTSSLYGNLPVQEALALA